MCKKFCGSLIGWITKFSKVFPHSVNGKKRDEKTRKRLGGLQTFYRSAAWDQGQSCQSWSVVYISEGLGVEVARNKVGGIKKNKKKTC